VLSEDEPDLALVRAAQARELPVPLVRLVAQPNLDVTEEIAVSSSEVFLPDGTATRQEMAVSLSYLLWRNPADRSDPINLADLDDHTRRALDEVPPWRRPAWLVESVKRRRYPWLWEAVRTTWLKDPAPTRTLTTELMARTEYILMNHYRPAAEVDVPVWERPHPRVPAKAVDNAVSAVIDGVQVPGAQIDTNPFVYSIGARLSANSYLTAVLPRDELQYLRVEFDTRTLATKQ